MDKQFWLSVKKNNFALPAGHAVLPLTEDLFSYLGSTDPELRDTIGLEAFSHWFDQGLYSVNDVRGLIPRLIANLKIGLGETESDSVFLRSFSILWLCVIAEHEIDKPSLTREEIASILDAALVYFAAERDLRGFDPVKGWAHAIAHSADLFVALARSSHTDAGDHIKILDRVAGKLKDSAHWVYLYGEDARLATSVLEIFVRGTLIPDQIKAWLASLSADWNNSWWDEGRARAFFNGRNFLRALHWKTLKADSISDKETILGMLRETLDQINPFTPPE